MKIKGGALSLVIAIILQSLFISGCWDSKEVEDLAVFTLLGVDRITEEGVDQWQVSARIMNIKAQGRKQGEGQGNGQGQSQTESPELLMKGTGLTFQDAITDIAKRMPRTPFYGQIGAVIIGKRVAEEKLPEMMELEMRYPATRPSTPYLVAEGEAFAVLQAEPELSSVLSKETQKLGRVKAQQSGVSYGVTTGRFMSWILSPDRDAVLARVRLFYPETGEKTTAKTIVVEGLGVFRGAKLVGWLDKDKTEGYLLLTQKIRQSEIRLAVAYDNKLFAYNLRSSDAKIEPEMEGDKLSFVIKLKTQGAVFETDGIDLTPEEIPALEEAIGEKIRELALGTVAKAKEYDADFLGLMQTLHRHRPDVWREVEDNWREAFAEAEIEVEVDAKVVSTGKLAKSLEVKE